MIFFNQPDGPRAKAGLFERGRQHRTTEITTFGRVVGRKGVKQRFPELVEKESLLVDIDYIAPILDQSAEEPDTQSSGLHLPP